MVDFSKLHIPSPEEREAAEAARPLCVTFSGSRHWRHRPPVQTAVRRLHAVGMRRAAHGKARGFDALVDAEARICEGLHVEPYEAAWQQHGKAAGIYRNFDMLWHERPHLVVAGPHADLIGTWHCAVSAECPVMVSLLGAGVREAIAAFARECGLDVATQRAKAVEAWVLEQARLAIVKARSYRNWPTVSMPDPRKAWALLTWGDPVDRRAQAGIDALLA